MYRRTAMAEQFMKAEANWGDRLKRNGTGYVGAGVEINPAWSTSDLEIERRKLVGAMHALQEEINGVKEWLAQQSAHHIKTGRYQDPSKMASASKKKRDLGLKRQSLQMSLSTVTSRLKEATRAESDAQLLDCIRAVATEYIGESTWMKIHADAVDLKRQRLAAAGIRDRELPDNLKS